ncbi:MAG: fatty acid desaturase, partial [Chitinophagaceae bacterium]
LFSRELSLFSRIVRRNRNEVKLTDESKPDLELVKKPAAELV